MADNKMSPILMMLNVGASVYLIGRLIWNHIQERKAYFELERELEASAKRREEDVPVNQIGEQNTLQIQEGTTESTLPEASNTENRTKVTCTVPLTKQAISTHVKGTIKCVTVNEKVVSNIVEQTNSEPEEVCSQVFIEEEPVKMGVIIEVEPRQEKVFDIEDFASNFDKIEHNFEMIASKEINNGNKESLEVILENELLVLGCVMPKGFETNPKHMFPNKSDMPILIEEELLENYKGEHQPSKYIPINELETVVEEEAVEEQPVEGQAVEEENSEQELEPLKEKLVDILSKHLVKDNVKENDLGTIHFQFQLSELKYPSFLELGSSEIKLIKDSYKRQELESQVLGKTRPKYPESDKKPLSIGSTAYGLQEKSLDSGSDPEEKPLEAKSNEISDDNSTTISDDNSSNIKSDDEDDWEDMEDEEDEAVGEEVVVEEVGGEKVVEEKDVDASQSIAKTASTCSMAATSAAVVAGEASNEETEQLLPLPFEVRGLTVTGRLMQVVPNDTQLAIGSQGDMGSSSATSVGSYEYADSY